MAMTDWAYMDAMCQVTNIVDKDKYGALVAAYEKGGLGRRETIRLFVDYLCSEDALHCRVPDHPAYETQFNLASRFSRAMLWRG